MRTGAVYSWLDGAISIAVDQVAEAVQVGRRPAGGIFGDLLLKNWTLLSYRSNIGGKVNITQGLSLWLDEKRGARHPQTLEKIAVATAKDDSR